MAQIIPLPVWPVSALTVTEAYDQFREAKLLELAQPTPENKQAATIAWRRWQTVERREEIGIDG